MASPSILLIEKEFLSREILNLTFTAHFNCNLIEVSSYQEALEVLNSDNAIDLVVVGDTKKSSMDTIAFVKALEDTGRGISMVLVRDVVSNYPSDLAGQLHREDGKSDLLDLCLDILSEKGYHIRSSESFIPVPVDILLKLDKLASPVYLRVSESKFVKYLNAKNILPEDLERIRKKNVSELYIRKNTFDEFIRNYRSELISKVLFVDRNVSLEEKMDLSIQAQELLLAAIKAFGFNEKTAAIANKNIALVKDIVRKSDHLMSLLGWGAKKDDKNFSYLHSTLLCYVSTALSQHMKFSIPYALEKMALAAFLHDMELSDHHIRNERQFIQGLTSKVSFNKEDSKIIADHPLKAANSVSKWAEAPTEVIFIVKHHHERSDGSGFPDHMKAEEMPDYLVCFLIAHDIVDLYLNFRDVNMVQKEFLELRKTYEGPLFQSISGVASELLSR